MEDWFVWHNCYMKEMYHTVSCCFSILHHQSQYSETYTEKVICDFKPQYLMIPPTRIPKAWIDATAGLLPAHNPLWRLSWCCCMKIRKWSEGPNMVQLTWCLQYDSRHVRICSFRAWVSQSCCRYCPLSGRVSNCRSDSLQVSFPLVNVDGISEFNSL